MPGIRGIPGTYPDHPELPELTRITVGSSENPTAPRKRVILGILGNAEGPAYSWTHWEKARTIRAM
eukprot:5521477-Prymnesium_polylepis.1